MNNNQYLYFLKKERLILILGILAGLLFFILYLASFFVAMYSSTVKLYIRNIPNSTVVAPYSSGSVVRSESGYSNPLFDYMEILKSQKLADGVYNRIQRAHKKDLDMMSVKSISRWHDVFPKMLTAKVEPSTDVVKVKFDWPNEKTSPEVFNALIDEYKDIVLGIRRSSDTTRRVFLDSQLASVSEKLDDVRRKIKDYRVTNSVGDLQTEGEELTKARVDLNKQLELNRSQIAAQSAKLRDLSSQLRVPNANEGLRASGIGQDPYLVQLTQSLSTAEQSKAKLSATLTDHHPDVVEINNQIATLKSGIASRRKETLNNQKVTRGIYDPAAMQIVTDLARAQADNQSLMALQSGLSKGGQDLQSQIDLLPAKRLGLEELMKNEKSYVLAYDNVLQKQMEARIQESAIVDNIIPLGAPTDPEFNKLPLLLKFLGFLLTGTLLGLLIAWIKHDIQDRWSGTPEMEGVTGAKVLGTLPWLSSSSKLAKTTIEPHDSTLGIAYASIASTLMARSYSENAVSMSFLSTWSTRMSSSVLPNIASVLSRSGKSVVIVDTDFAHPNRYYESLGLSKPTGVFNHDLVHLINEINGLQRSQGRTLSPDEAMALINPFFQRMDTSRESGGNSAFLYLGATQTASNVYDYVSSDGFRTLLETLKTQFDFVLVDTPPKPFIHPEIASVVTRTDGVVLISAMRSARKVMTSMVNRLRSMDAKILGIISRDRDAELEKLGAESQAAA